MSRIRTFENAGLRPSFASGSQVDNASRGITQRVKQNKRQLDKDIEDVAKHNKKVKANHQRSKREYYKGEDIWAELQDMREDEADEVDITQKRGEMRDHRKLCNKIDKERRKLRKEANELPLGPYEIQSLKQLSGCLGTP
ncbi:hypothetical protein V5O48_019318 [Marasmius crinis-equi]|uniref:Uncharacterized protein n=1 Tax=Marasmius crinis-equi TaxID=585013 RepID=A0ABR3EIP4_9AGAR